ncbi:MAG: family peptidase, partial [Phenylobacterium sp.]|nr:family peptidase [Phenylobacterium sp.]
MAGLMMALALAAQPAPAAQVRGYQDLALSPKGDLIATVETDELFQSEADPHGVVVVRNRANGKVVARYDPCASCFYAGPAWSPDGAALAFVSSDLKAKSATLQVVRAGKATVALAFDGLLEAPRWSPDGATLAVLATERPSKQTGATQAGAAQVGEIGSA